MGLKSHMKEPDNRPQQCRHTHSAAASGSLGLADTLDITALGGAHLPRHMGPRGVQGCFPPQGSFLLPQLQSSLITLCLLLNGRDLWAGTIYFPAGPTTMLHLNASQQLHAIADRCRALQRTQMG